MFHSTFEFDNENNLNDDYSFYSNQNCSNFGNETKLFNIIDFYDNSGDFPISDFLFYEKQKTNPKTYLNKKVKSNDILDNNNNIANESDFLFQENNSYKKIKIVGKQEDLENNKIFKEINLKENNEEEKEIDDKNTIKNNNTQKCGRKTEIEKNNGNKGKHTKKNEDNIIRKIKSFFGKKLYLFIKKSFKKETDLLKLEIDINRNLKKDFNIKLFNNTLKNIYMNSKISEHYSIKNVETNEELINKIYNENKETEVIKILDLTYIEAFQIFRRNLVPINEDLKTKIEGTKFLNKEYFNDVEKFLEKIRLEGKNKKENEEDTEQYIEDIISLVIGFEEWFNSKTGRER